MPETTIGADAAQTNGQSSGAGSSQNGQQQSNGFQLPAGHRLVAESDWAALQRADQQARGASALMSEAKKHGLLGKTGSLDTEFLESISQLRERGLDPRKLAGMLQTKIEGDGEAQAGQKPVDIEALKKELLGEVDKKNARFKALSEYEMGEKQFMDGLPANLKKLLGEDATDADIELHKLAVLGARYSNPSVFDEAHPLASERPRYGGWDDVRPTIEKLLTESKAQRAARIGDAANKKPKPSTPAGKSGDQGRAENSETSRPSRTERIASAQKILAKHTGQA